MELFSCKLYMNFDLLQRQYPHHLTPRISLPCLSEIITRPFRSIDLPRFRTDIAQGLGDLDDSLPVTDLLDIYDTQLTAVLNKHAPSKEKSIVIRPQQPWFSDDLHRAKSEKRKAERLCRRTGQTVHREIFNEEKPNTTSSLKVAKCHITIRGSLIVGRIQKRCLRQ